MESLFLGRDFDEWCKGVVVFCDGWFIWKRCCRKGVSCEVFVCVCVCVRVCVVGREVVSDFFK